MKQRRLAHSLDKRHPWITYLFFYGTFLLCLPKFTIAATVIIGGFALWAWLFSKAADIGPWAVHTFLYLGWQYSQPYSCTLKSTFKEL